MAPVFPDNRLELLKRGCIYFGKCALTNRHYMNMYVASVAGVPRFIIAICAIQLIQLRLSFQKRKL